MYLVQWNIFSQDNNITLGQIASLLIESAYTIIIDNGSIEITQALKHYLSKRKRRVEERSRNVSLIYGSQLLHLSFHTPIFKSLLPHAQTNKAVLVLRGIVIYFPPTHFHSCATIILHILLI